MSHGFQSFTFVKQAKAAPTCKKVFVLNVQVKQDAGGKKSFHVKNCLVFLLQDLLEQVKGF